MKSEKGLHLRSFLHYMGRLGMQPAGEDAGLGERKKR